MNKKLMYQVEFPNGHRKIVDNLDILFQVPMPGPHLIEVWSNGNMVTEKIRLEVKVREDKKGPAN